MSRILHGAALVISPAALCLWFIVACVGFSVAGSNASKTLTVRQETKAAATQVSVPVEMKRWDELLYNRVMTQSKSEMGEFLKAAEQDPESKPAEAEQGWRPSVEKIRYIEQFRTFTHVSYLIAISTAANGGQPVTTLRTLNFDKSANREVTLADLIEGATDRSKALEAMADYARADLKDQIGEEEETDALSELTKADIGVYSRFTFCPSTKPGNAAGLTIHFEPPTSGPYEGKAYRVTIPPTVFSKFLKPGVKTFFSGEPRQAAVPIEDAT